MRAWRILQYAISMTWVLSLLIGCGTTPTTIPPTAKLAAAPTPTPTAMPPTATLTAAPTPTPVVSTAATVIAARGDKEWDLVVMGDCLMPRIIPRYAAHLERDLGIKIKTHDWTRSELASGYMLEDLRTDPELRQDIGDAEVVIFDIGLEVFVNPANTYSFGSAGACGGTDNQDCLREALKSYKADTDAIFAELVSLRSPSEVLIRAMDIHEFTVQDWKEAGVFDVINRYKQDANEHMIQVASEHHIPVARVYAAFRGPDGDEDPMDKGYAYDGFRPTEEGADLMAELFRQLGYGYAPPKP